MSTSITLYSFPPSQNAVRTEIALREKGLPFEKVGVDLLKGENRQPPMADLTPRGQVPVLVYETDDQKIVVYESIATIRFIDDVCPEPPLMPPVEDLARRAQATIRIEEFQAKLDPVNIFGSVAFGKQTKAELQPRIDSLLAEVDRWNEYVEGKRYLAGDQFTLADIAVFPLLMHFEALGLNFAKRVPALADYVEACKQRPSVADSGWVETFLGLVSRLDAEPVLAD